MRLKSVLLTFLCALVVSFSGHSQSKKELDKLMDEAFVSLESNAPDVTEKANKLLEAGQKAQLPIYQINAYTILGIVNKNKGYYVTSVDFYNNALKVAEESQDDGRISACYNNIGSVYQIQENYGKALSYYKKSLDFEEKLNNPLQKSIRLYNIGEIYREMDSLSLALSNFNNSLIIEKEFNNNEGIVYALLGISDVYLQLDRPTDASISLDEAKLLIKETDVEVLIIYHKLYGELLYVQGSFDKAILELQKAKSLSKKNEFRVHLMDIYETELKIKTAQEKQALAEKKEGEEESNSNSSSMLFLFFGFTVILIIVGAIYRRNRGKKTNSASTSNTSEPQAKVTPMFKMESDKGKILIEIELDKILCFEANDNYVNIYHLLEDESVKKTMERISLKKIEEQLTTLSSDFGRVHKSYLINPKKIAKIGGKAQAYRIHLEHLDKEIPVSRNFDIGQFQA